MLLNNTKRTQYNRGIDMGNNRTITKTLAKVVLTLLAFLFVGHIGFIVYFGFKISSLRTENPRSTAIMRFRQDIQSPETFLSLYAVPEDLIKMILYIEDFHFYRHHGFNAQSIRYAVRLNRKLGYKAYGGSTVTQQLARTLYLHPRKTYFRKYLELILAVEMEVLLNKQRILELYLNYAEWGPNVYGIGDAARFHFQKSAYALLLEEKSALVTILSSPLNYHVNNFRENHLMKLRYDAIKRYAQRMFVPNPQFISTLKEIPRTESD